MSKSVREIMYSPGKNDECHTPPEGVLPILQYIRLLLLEFSAEGYCFIRIARGDE